MIAFGRTFFKLSGSGNDFVAFDELGTRSGYDPAWLTAEAIRALCARGQGVGADGVMVLRGASESDCDYQLLYYNADGSRAELCGNASLCSVRLATELGVARPAGMRFRTDAGLVTGRMDEGQPEVDLAPATELNAERGELGLSEEDERRIGFARVGVPHVVVLCADADAVDVAGRGARLRHHPALRDGANVNYVSRRGDEWRIRTFERGVEAETLACGTGSVASALLLDSWSRGGAAGEGAGDRIGPDDSAAVQLITSSGLRHRVRLRRAADGTLEPSLGGAASVVFRGELGEGRW